jgi:hypothetical protein
MENTDGRLVVHYSRTGKTERVARDLAWRLGANVESIIDAKNRNGLPGFLAGGPGVRNVVQAALLDGTGDDFRD